MVSSSVNCTSSTAARIVWVRSLMTSILIAGGYATRIVNALNQNPIVGFMTVTGARFKEVITVLDPRAARFGIRWDF